jgi:hypothetical protein
MTPVGLGTRNHCAGEDQQKFSSQSVAAMILLRDGTRGIGISFVRIRYQAMVFEDTEDLAYAVVRSRVCE